MNFCVFFKTFYLMYETPESVYLKSLDILTYLQILLLPENTIIIQKTHEIVCIKMDVL